MSSLALLMLPVTTSVRLSSLLQNLSGVTEPEFSYPSGVLPSLSTESSPEEASAKLNVFLP